MIDFWRKCEPEFVFRNHCQWKKTGGPGDIFTIAYGPCKGKENFRLVDEKGKVRKVCFDAQKEGVDVWPWRVRSFVFEQAIPAIKTGVFYLILLSTDLHTGKLNGGMKGNMPQYYVPNLSIWECP